MLLKRHCGVIVPMVTPFAQDGTIDEGAVRRLVENLITGGVDGIFVLGTTGEVASISIADRLKLVLATIHAAAGRTPIYAGISGNCLQESIDAAQRYELLGVHAAVAHAPAYYPVPDGDLEKYFGSMAEKIDLPLLIYNIPKVTHLSLPLDLIERLSHHPNIEGVKDSAADGQRLIDLLRRVGRRDNFSVLCGCGTLFSEALKLGADGVVPSSANLVPELYHAMWKASLQGQWEEVDRQQKLSTSAGDRYQHGRTLGESLAALKALLSAKGVCGPTVLPPLRTLSPEECP